jgi:hypothetical protein
MVRTFSKAYTDLITSGAYVFLFAVMIASSGSRTMWIVCLTLILITSIFAWISTWRRRRMIIDTPTSRIASAAQGYVELIGTGHSLDDTQLVSHLNGLPCLWYRWLVRERTGNNKWVTVDKGESERSFIINDGSGRCIIDLDGAEILTRHRDRWRHGNYSYTEWKLLNNEQIYAIGEFRTVGGASAELNVRRDTSELISAWKKDRGTLLERFDLDRDGELSEHEWELARQAARREVSQMHSEARNSSDMHTLSRSVHGFPYLISNIDPDKLARRYLLWTFFHLAAFLAALGAFNWLPKPYTPSPSAYPTQTACEFYRAMGMEKLTEMMGARGAEMLLAACEDR